MNKIIEAYFKMQENDELSKLVVNHFGKNWEQSYLNEYGHLIYINTEPKQVIKAVICSSNQPNHNNFVDLLSKINNNDFDEILLLLSVYPQYDEIIQSALRSNALLDSFLTNTKGWIVYNNQLENLLIMATNANKNEAEKFRKSYNMRNLHTISKYVDIKLFNTTIGNIINERMKFYITFTPKYYEARVLYEYLNYGHSIKQ